MPNHKTTAERAYEAYGAVTNNRNFQGNPMPKWADLPPIIRGAWANAAACAMSETVTELAERMAELGEPLNVDDASDVDQVREALCALLSDDDVLGQDGGQP